MANDLEIDLLDEIDNDRPDTDLDLINHRRASCWMFWSC